MKRTKKGISVLISTVMIILITLAAVGIVWQVVIPLIQTSMETSKLCSNMQLAVDTEGGYTFYNTSHVSVMVGATLIGGGEMQMKELEGVQIKVNYDGKSKMFDSRDLDPLKPVPNINEEWTYLIDRTAGNITGTPNGVAVAAILRVGGKEHVCQMAPKATLETA